MDNSVHLEGQVQILVLAAHDMKQVIAACAALEQSEDRWTGSLQAALEEALETAIAVSYARPFSARNKLGALPDRWRPRVGTPERELHDWLIQERNRRYAHTDEDSGRLVLHRNEPDGRGFDGLVVLRLPYPRDRLPAIRALAADIGDRLWTAAFELQRRLEGFL
jgi:hypothetical protein